MAFYGGNSSSSSDSGEEAVDDQKQLSEEALSAYIIGVHVSETSSSPDSEDGEQHSSAESEQPAKMASRAYQLEMFEESLKQNIIVTVRWLETFKARAWLTPSTRWTLEAVKLRCKPDLMFMDTLTS